MNNLAEKIAKLLEDKKAQDVNVIDVEGKSPICDYFVIASGNSNTQVKALCTHLEEELEKDNIRPKHIEGYAGATWILMDYGDVIVHIFYYETREFYSLEDMWEKAQNAQIEAED